MSSSIYRPSNDDLDLMMCLPESELTERIRSLKPSLRRMLQQQLANHPSPKERAEASLHEYVKQVWHVVEPGVPFIDGWHIQAICEHLQAVTDGRIKRLLINVPPGCCKSLLCCVFWPTWV